MAMPIASRYWDLSDLGEAHEPEEPGYRWQVDSTLDNTQEWRLQEGQSIDDWPERVEMKCHTPGPAEDMPCCGCVGHLMSDRLRRLIEARAPDHAQYLPVVMMYKDKPLDIGPYWMANWLHVIDCIDEEKSDIRPSKYPDLPPNTVNLVVDPRRVPEDVLICRTKTDSLMVLIRDDLKREIQEAGMTGCQFYRVDHSADR